MNIVWKRKLTQRPWRVIILGLICTISTSTLIAEDKDAPQAEQDGFSSIEKLTEEAQKSVVVISFSGRDGEQAGIGAGFIISADGLIATNLHVIGEARPIQVRLKDGRQFDVSSIHATDRSVDLAIIKINAKDLPVLELADSDKLKQGQQVLALGNPLGLKHSVVAGVVSGRRKIEGMPMIQLAMPIEAGNSGGPVLDRTGKVHGIVTLKSLVSENLGFAVAVNALKPLIKKPNPVPISHWLTIGALNADEWSPVFGARWRQRAGRILVSGKGKGIGGRSLCVLQEKTPELPFEISVTVRLDAEDGAAGLVFHSDGSNKHYGFYPSNGQLRLSRFDGPDVFSWQVLTQKRSKSYQPGEWNTLKVRLDTNKIQCFVNDELVIESEDGQYSTGKIGLAKFRETKAEFKQFRVGKDISSPKMAPEVVEQIDKLLKKLPINRPAESTLVEKLAASQGDPLLILDERSKTLEKQVSRLKELRQVVHRERVQARLIKLLSEDEGKIDLLKTALLLARLDNPELEIEPYLKEVDLIIKKVKTTDKSTQLEKLKALDEVLFEQMGFHGSRTEYYNRSNSYLNEVIDDREGLPITLSVLYMELARKLGLKVVGVGLPGHFVVRFEPEKGDNQLIDVFDRGKRLSKEDAENKIRGLSGTKLTDEHLKSQSKKEILIRMLHNLMGLARDSSDANGMLNYVDTIVAIDSQRGEERWFRAVLNFQTDRYDEAMEDTEWLLKHRPPGVDIQRVREFQQVLIDAEQE